MIPNSLASLSKNYVQEYIDKYFRFVMSFENYYGMFGGDESNK